VDLQQPSRAVIDDGREPMLSADGQSWLFYATIMGGGS